ncbi:MAG: helix-turn-helix transcriptional regulator [Acidimicrobiales bacterium]
MPRQLPLPDHWRELGDFIREQRSTARLSLRRLSELAGISNPYLSQIERGLRKPSAEILQQIAKALRISAETLYVQAGILEPTGSDDVQRAVLADANLSEEHKQTLLRIYASFLHENESDAEERQSAQGGSKDAVLAEDEAPGQNAVSGEAEGVDEYDDYEAGGLEYDQASSSVTQLRAIPEP